MAAIIRGPQITIADDDLVRFTQANPGWKFERADDGSLFVSPTSTNGASKEAEALIQLHAFAKRAGGRVYSATAGFRTPGGGIMSPDAAWVRAEIVAEFAGVGGFWSVMPDVAVEVASPSDSWPLVRQKIDAYAAAGVRYAVAIEPVMREIYERGERPSGLTLDFDAVMDA